MKNKLLLAGVLVLAMAVVFKVGMVLGEGGRITEVCRLNGGILVDRTNCPGGALPVKIGELPTGSDDDTGTIGSGYIRFVAANSGGAAVFLSSDGNVWNFAGEGDVNPNQWYVSSNVGISVDNITYWNSINFIADGMVYELSGTSWVKMTNLPTPTPVR